MCLKQTRHVLQQCFAFTFSDCTVTVNGLKISKANGNYAHKISSKPNFLTIEMPKAPGWHVKTILMKQTQEELQHPKLPDEKL